MLALTSLFAVERTCAKLEANDPEMKELNLAGKKIGNVGLEVLCKSLNKHKFLRKVNLSNNRIGDEGVKVLAATLRANRSIQVLNLSENQLGDNGAAFLAASLFHDNQIITSLDLSHNRIRHEGAKILANLVELTQTLEELNVGYNEMAGDGSSELMRALMENTTVKRLNLANNKIGMMDMYSISQVFTNNSTLVELDMQGNGMGMHGAATLASALRSGAQSPRRLKLAQNDLGPIGTKAVASILSSCPALQYLDLRDNNLGPKGVSEIAQALQQLPCFLTELGLAQNNIGSYGIKTLTNALLRNTSLTFLDLRSNEIGACGMKELAPAFSDSDSSSCLKKLLLSCNQLGDEGVRVMGDILKTNTTLHYLGLQQNDVSALGANVLSNALCTNTSLQALMLNYNKIGNTGVKALAAMLADNSALQVLDLASNRIDCDGVEDLAMALQRNESLRTLSLAENNVGNVGGQHFLTKCLLHRSYYDDDDEDDDDAENPASPRAKKNSSGNTTLSTLNLTGSGVTDRAVVKGITHALAVNAKMARKLEAAERASLRRRSSSGSLPSVVRMMTKSCSERSTFTDTTQPMSPEEDEASALTDEDGAPPPVPTTPPPSPFFSKLLLSTLPLQQDKQDELEETLQNHLKDLSSAMGSATEQKVFYTLVSALVRLQTISPKDKARFLEEFAAQDTVIVSKAQQDGVHMSEATVAAQQTSPTSLAKCIFDNTRGLDGILSLQQLQGESKEQAASSTLTVDDLRPYMETYRTQLATLVMASSTPPTTGIPAPVAGFQAAVSFVRLMLNASLLHKANTPQNAENDKEESVWNAVVDFTDVPHMLAVGRDVSPESLALQALLKVCGEAEGASSQGEDEPVHPFFVIAAAARSLNMGRTSDVTESSSEAQEPVKQDKPQDDDDENDEFYDAELDDDQDEASSRENEVRTAELPEDEEEDCPLHAAVKYDDEELLLEELDNIQSNKDRRLSVTDSLGRTALDYAAMKGRDKMARLLKERGARYRILAEC